MGEGVALGSGGEELELVDLPAAAAADSDGEPGDDDGLDGGAELRLSGVDRDQIGRDAYGLVVVSGLKLEVDGGLDGG